MRKYTVTQTETTPNGRQIVTKIKTDDEEVIRRIIDSRPTKKNDAMEAEYRDIKKTKSKLDSKKAITLESKKSEKKKYKK